LEMALGLLQEEAVGTPQLQQLAIGPVLANELQAMSEFAPQHRLGAEVIRIAIGTAARERGCRVVGCCVGARGLGPPNPAAQALQHIAAVVAEAKPMLGGATTGRTRPHPTALREMLGRRGGGWTGWHRGDLLDAAISLHGPLFATIQDRSRSSG